MGLKPQRLQLGVTVFLVGELVVLQDVVHFPEVPQVESHDSSGSEDALRLVQLLHIRVSHRKGPQEPPQPLNVSALLQGLTDCRYLEGGSG